MAVTQSEKSSSRLLLETSIAKHSAIIAEETTTMVAYQRKRAFLMKLEKK